MGFRENVEALLLRSHWSQRELAAAGISSRRALRSRLTRHYPRWLQLPGSPPQIVRDEGLPASSDELELASHCRGDLSSPDAGAVHAFLAYLREARAKGTGMADKMILILRRLRSLRFNACVPAVRP
jgi:hypothetical protein